MDDSLTRRDIISVSLLSGALALGVPHLSTDNSEVAMPPAGGNLRDRAKKKGLLVGSAVSAPMLGKDAQLRGVLQLDANVVVPENELKWVRLQPQPDGPLDFGPAEQIYRFAAQNNMAMRGHCLTWWNGNPDWTKDKLASLTPGALGDYLQKHIAAVVGHWRGRIVQWDVANEVITNRGVLVDKLWVDKLGERYLDLAYEAARDADPNAKLTLNHNLIEQEQPYQIGVRASVLKLLESLKSRNVPVDMLAIESHLNTAYSFSETAWRTFLDSVTGLGLDLMITELDVNDGGTIGTIDRRDSSTAALCKSYLDVTLSYRQCRGLLTWGEVDSDSWLNKTPDKRRADGVPLRPTPRDGDYRPKPMWRAIAAALDGAPAR